jgi:hypothetical protein
MQRSIQQQVQCNFADSYYVEESSNIVSGMVFCSLRSISTVECYIFLKDIFIGWQSCHLFHAILSAII